MCHYARPIQECDLGWDGKAAKAIPLFCSPFDQRDLRYAGKPAAITGLR